MENMWLINRNKAVSDKRENEEIQNHILNWSTNKGIVDQEINRKNELTYYCSNFNKIGKVIEVTFLRECSNLILFLFILKGNNSKRNSLREEFHS